MREPAELLAGRYGRYVYTSTVPVYNVERQHHVEYMGSIRAAPGPFTEEVNSETCWPKKDECDRIVQAICGDACTFVRPTFVVGPGDHTDRFTF